MNTLNNIINNGGGNLKNGEAVNYTSGYMVGVSNIATLNNTVELQDAFNGYLQLSKYMNVGFWCDTTDGKWYVDFSENIKSLDVALLLAGERGELAIWDCQAFDEIRVA